MSKSFKKGQEVTYFVNYDRRGTVAYRHAIVYSCGAKRMVLTDAVTGKEMGRNYDPFLGRMNSETIGNTIYSPGGTFPRVSDEEAEAMCLHMGAEIVRQEQEQFAHCLSLGWGEGYDRSIRKQIEQLHEPRAMKI